MRDFFFRKGRRKGDAKVGPALAGLLSEEGRKRMASRISSGPLMATEVGIVTVRYLIAVVREDDLCSVPGLLGKAGEIIKRSRGAIACVLPPLVLTTFGTPLDRDGTEAQRLASAATALVQELGSDIKVIYGTVEGYHGLVSIGSYMHFGPVLPGLQVRLQRLMSAEFGTATAVND
jgi:hypothetical protein